MNFGRNTYVCITVKWICGLERMHKLTCMTYMRASLRNTLIYVYVCMHVYMCISLVITCTHMLVIYAKVVEIYDLLKQFSCRKSTHYAQKLWCTCTKHDESLLFILIYLSITLLLKQNYGGIQEIHHFLTLSKTLVYKVDELYIQTGL